MKSVNLFWLLTHEVTSSPESVCVGNKCGGSNEAFHSEVNRLACMDQDFVKGFNADVDTLTFSSGIELLLIASANIT